MDIFSPFALVCLMFLGDSISAADPGFGNMPYPYTHTVNIAIGGADTLYWEGPEGQQRIRDGGELCPAASERRVAHVMLGTNDVAREAAHGQFRHSLTAIITDLQGEGFVVIVSRQIPNFNTSFGMDLVRRQAEFQYLTEQARIATGAVQGFDGRALELIPLHYTDGIHPTLAGHRVLFAAVAERLWQLRLDEYQRTFDEHWGGK